MVKFENTGQHGQGEVEPLYSALADEPEFVEVVAQFVDKLPEIIVTIDETYGAGEWEKFRVVVHNLKGMGGGFGFPQLSKQAIEVEKLLNAGEYAAIEPIILVLHRLAQRIQAGR